VCGAFVERLKTIHLNLVQKTSTAKPSLAFPYGEGGIFALAKMTDEAKTKGSESFEFI
jgi:hypothetical protein